MKLSDENRQIITQHHLRKAEQMMDLADELVQTKHFDAACNRYYYACFHAVHALFVANELETKTHEGMMKVFGLEFVLAGKFDKKYGVLLNKMEQLRHKADYNCIAEVSEDEVARITRPAHEFFELVKRNISI